MKFKRQSAIFGILLMLIVASRYWLSHFPHIVFAYNTYVYYPIQSFRNLLFDAIPFSVGDVLYILGGAALLYTLVIWVYLAIKFRTYKYRLGASILGMANIVLFAWLYFIFGWGANYYKPSLRHYWGLQEQHTHDTAAILAFDKMLVCKLNDYAPHYHTLSLKQIDGRAKKYYHTYTDCRMNGHGLDVKPSLFGNIMERVGVDGYYNPFTGEGQMNGYLPAFMQPFVLCHEMAHQAGIAAEDDANLMAYALGTLTNDSTFNYSSYLNIWLYAHNRLYRRDSVMALNLERQLNKLTLAHIDTLEQISRRYHNAAARYTNEIYDGYLKMQDQKEGIRSYGNVASTAYLLELKRTNETSTLIRIP